ncbi:hypothetical protein Drorol1_Dr00019320 [Drosera rotundifolia]
MENEIVCSLINISHSSPSSSSTLSLALSSFLSTTTTKSSSPSSSSLIGAFACRRCSPFRVSLLDYHHCRNQGSRNRNESKQKQTNLNDTKSMNWEKRNSIEEEFALPLPLPQPSFYSSIDYIFKDSTARIVKIGDNPGCPCGGAHVVDISDINGIKVITSCSYMEVKNSTFLGPCLVREWRHIRLGIALSVMGRCYSTPQSWRQCDPFGCLRVE